MFIDINSLAQGIHRKDRRSIARAITLAESTKYEDQVLCAQLLQKLNKQEARRIGVTGSPGAGKSSFINTLGLHLLHKTSLGILVIDPSSPLYGGSILGDKTRMGELEQHNNVFIRPSPNKQGSISSGLRASIRILEAAGFETIIIETVGAGQSEYEIATLIDLLLLIQIPNSGDELQGMKKGLLEIADIIIINKADGSLEHAAKTSLLEHRSSLSIHKDPPPLFLASSQNQTGFSEIIQCIDSEITRKKKNGQFTKKRQEQNLQCFERESLQLLKSSLQKSEHSSIYECKEKITQHQEDPSYLAHQWVKNILKNH